MRFRPLIFSALALGLLAGCKSSEVEQPAHPSLGGVWRAEANAKKGCDRESVRFAKDRIIMRREGRELPIFQIERLAATGSAIDMDLAVAELALFAAGAEQKKTEEISQRRIFVTLSVDGDTIRLRDAQMSDPKRGRYVPDRRERQQMDKIFAFRKCPPKTS